MQHTAREKDAQSSDSASLACPIAAGRHRLVGLRVVQHLPPSLTELGQLSAHRQVSDNP